MIDYTDVFPSPQFKFLVTEEETPLTIHTAILKGLSEPLNAMINNGTMKESSSGVAALEDIDVDIFTAFCEYAYSACFLSTRAKYVKKELRKERTVYKSDTSSNGAQSKADESAVESDESDEPRGADGPSKGDAVEVDSRWDLDMVLDFWDFRKRQFKMSSRWSTYVRRRELVFSVKVYIFATRYLVEPLRQYCLQHLHENLCESDLTMKNFYRILDLLKFTYLHTSSQEPSGRSLVRELVIHYVACKFDILSQNEDWDRLLRSNGEIGADLFRAMVKWRHRRKCKCQCFDC